MNHLFVFNYVDIRRAPPQSIIQLHKLTVGRDTDTFEVIGISERPLGQFNPYTLIKYIANGDPYLCAEDAPEMG